MPFLFTVLPKDVMLDNFRSPLDNKVPSRFAVPYGHPIPLSHVVLDCVDGGRILHVTFDPVEGHSLVCEVRPRRVSSFLYKMLL